MKTTIVSFLSHNPLIGNSAAVVSSSLLASAEALNNPAPSYFKILVEAGMVGVLLVFLLRVLPEILDHSRKIHQDARDTIRENNESNLAAQKQLVESFERVNNHWRNIIEQRGYCPIRDGKSSDNTEKK